MQNQKEINHKTIILKSNRILRHKLPMQSFKRLLLAFKKPFMQNGKVGNWGKMDKKVKTDKRDERDKSDKK